MAAQHVVAVVVMMAVMMGVAAADFYPPPFTRPLQVSSPPIEGDDVYVLQNLLLRAKFGVPELLINSKFDDATSRSLANFQKAASLPANGNLDAASAAAVLDKLEDDGYVDNALPEKMGYLYKVFVPVHRNRSIETMATLYSANNTALFTFLVRAHGTPLYYNATWPDYNETDPGISQFGSNGNTLTGLYEFDLNSPEDEPELYGQWPINRATNGLEGNAAIAYPKLRYGILLHTGEWPGWQPGQQMPNSDGCVHTYPDSVKTIWSILTSMGVQVRPNPFGLQPYPYRPQGLLSVQLVSS